MLPDVPLQAPAVLSTTPHCNGGDDGDIAVVDVVTAAARAVSAKGDSGDDSLTNGVFCGSDVSSYILIINRLQEKVHALQAALLANERCSALAGILQPNGSQPVSDVSLHHGKRCFPGVNSTQRRRTEWIRALDANSALQSLQHVSSKFQMGGFDAWCEGALHGLPCKDGMKPGNIANGSKEEEEVSSVVPRLCVKGDDFNRPTRDAILTLDPVIVMDVSAMLGKERQGAGVGGGKCDTLNEMNESIRQLTSENNRLQAEVAEAQSQIDLRAKDMALEKKRVEELGNDMEELRRCNAKLLEDRAAARRQCDEAVAMAGVYESKLKEMTANMESLREKNEQLRAECVGAKHDAAASWRDVQSLEGELRQWEHKERELKRLRILMRFSELKKDSDRLSGLSLEKEMVDKEQERLRGENIRLRTLIAEYRRRLEEASKPAVVSEPDRSAPEVKLESGVDGTWQTCAAASRIRRPEVRNGIQDPTLPPAPVESSRRKSTTEGRHRRKLKGAASSSFSAFPSHSRKAPSLFDEDDDDGGKHRQRHFIGGSL